jgi:threonylcarbamoyladenosine tRNA methylthiotransferase MtaB
MVKDVATTRVSIDTLGCKLNQAESELMVRQLVEAGCQMVSSASEADIYILNTCTVTHTTDSKSRHLLRAARRQNPDIRQVLIGCFTERALNELNQVAKIDMILSNADKRMLIQKMQQEGYLGRPGQAVNDPKDNQPYFKTRSFIKIQEGCQNYCTYCIVPFVRGEEENTPTEEIIAAISHKAASGCNEVILTGTKIGSYRYNGINLVLLLKRILNDVGAVRLRMSSLQPRELSSELVELWQDERLCRHFHLSLQSGNAEILSRMRREYSIREYQDAIHLIRNQVPEVAITTDIIVGFPGETDEEFQVSYDFCRQIAFSRIHVFPYSPRHGTVAAHMPNKIRDSVKKERTQKMLALAQESMENFNRGFLGKTMSVLWEKQVRDKWSGYTDNYIKVYTENNRDLTNQLTQVNLGEIRVDGVWGTVLE